MCATPGMLQYAPFLHSILVVWCTIPFLSPASQFSGCGQQESCVPDVAVIFVSSHVILIILLLMVCEMDIIVLTEKSKVEHL